MDEATEARMPEVLTVQRGGIRREGELSEGCTGRWRCGGGAYGCETCTHTWPGTGKGLLNYMELIAMRPRPALSTMSWNS